MENGCAKIGQNGTTLENKKPAEAGVYLIRCFVTLSILNDLNAPAED